MHSLANPPAATTRRRRPGRVSPVLTWGLLSPYLLLLLAFGVVPIGGAIWSAIRGDPTRGDHVGVQALSRAFGNLNFSPAVVNVGSFLLVFLPALLVIATVVALVLHSRPGRFATTMRLAYYLPGAVVGAPLVLLWLFMLTPELSPFHRILTAFGLDRAADVFTAGHLPFIFAVMAIYSGVGGWIVVLHGSLDALDSSITEAARMDGANALQTAWYIKLPLIRGYVAFIAIISFAGGAQLVAEPTLVNAALPGTVSQTWSLNQLAFYYAFQQNDASAASAYAIFLMAIGVIAALVLIYGLRTYSDADGARS